MFSGINREFWGYVVKIGKLGTWTTTDVILYLLRFHAPGQTIGYWQNVYLPCLRDGSGLLLERRMEQWCRRWKIGPDRSASASKLMFFAFDSYWRECVLERELTPEESRFKEAIEADQLHHFRWIIWVAILGKPYTGSAANPGPMSGRRGRKPEGGEETRVDPKAVRMAVRHLFDRAGLPPVGPRLPGRPRKEVELNGCAGKDAFVKWCKIERVESPRNLRSIYLQLSLCWITAEGYTLKRVDS
jgi:hypothetical protein